MGTIGLLSIVRGLSHAEGPRDHDARSAEEVSTMSRRGMHPLLMAVDKPERNVEDKNDSGLSGYESAQHRRFLRAEAEESDSKEIA